MAELTNDFFNNPAFSVASLTDAINNIPFIPGRAGQVIEWEEEGVATTSILLEERNEELVLINPTQRGGPGVAAGKEGERKARSLIIPHYQIDDFIKADSVQGVRAFGRGSELETIQSRVNAKLRSHVQLRHDPTLEYQRIGAIKGVILNGDGTTLYNLFDEFGVTQAPEFDLDLDNASAAPGSLVKVCNEIERAAADAMGGVPFGGLHSFCGNALWDDLIRHKDVIDSQRSSVAQAMVLLSANAYGQAVLQVGRITFENYQGAVGGTPFIATDKAHIFPIRSPGLWRTVYAPADYEETVNTEGLPRYAKQYPSLNGKGRHLETQMNALSYCTRPRALIKAKRT